MSIKRVPDGKWKDFSFVLSEAQRIKKEHGFENLPSQSQLVKLGYGSFVNSLTSHHNGLNALRTYLGEPIKKQSPGTWNNKEFILSQARVFMQQNDFSTLPAYDVICEFGRSDLVNAVTKFYGGFGLLRKDIGQACLRQDSAIVRDGNYILERARAIMLDHDFTSLPGSCRLRKLGYQGFVTAANRHHGGIKSIRKLLGQNQLKKEDGHYREWNVIESELLPIIDQLGHFPTKTELEKVEKSALDRAISKYHGGLNAARKKMGYEPAIKPVGYAENWENIERELGDVTTKIGHFPTDSELRELKLGHICNAITKYHGGYRKVREKLGQAQTQHEKGAWKRLEFALTHARAFLAAYPEYTSLPSHKELHKNGYSSLSRAIVQNHGGFPIFRAKLEETMPRLNHNINLLEGYVEAEA